MGYNFGDPRPFAIAGLQRDSREAWTSVVTYLTATIIAIDGSISLLKGSVGSGNDALAQPFLK